LEDIEFPGNFLAPETKMNKAKPYFRALQIDLIKKYFG